MYDVRFRGWEQWLELDHLPGPCPYESTLTRERGLIVSLTRRDEIVTDGHWKNINDVQPHLIDFTGNGEYNVLFYLQDLVKAVKYVSFTTTTDQSFRVQWQPIFTMLGISYPNNSSHQMSDPPNNDLPFSLWLKRNWCKKVELKKKTCQAKSVFSSRDSVILLIWRKKFISFKKYLKNQGCSL